MSDREDMGVRREWAARIADQYSVDDPVAIDAIEEGLARGAMLSAGSAREALRRIAYLRPAGDVETCKSPRALVEQMERIALSALAQSPPQGGSN